MEIQIDLQHLIEDSIATHYKMSGAAIQMLRDKLQGASIYVASEKAWGDRCMATRAKVGIVASTNNNVITFLTTDYGEKLIRKMASDNIEYTYRLDTYSLTNGNKIGQVERIICIALVVSKGYVVPSNAAVEQMDRDSYMRERVELLLKLLAIKQEAAQSYIYLSQSIEKQRDIDFYSGILEGFVATRILIREYLSEGEDD